MNIAAIAAAYHVFTRGSEGFCNFISERSGLWLSNDEIRRIALIAQYPDDFARVYETEDFWRDHYNGG